MDSKHWNLIKINNNIQPSGLSFLSAAVQNNHLYVFGGNGDQNARSNEIYRYKLPDQPKSTLKNDFYKFLKKQLFCDLKFLCRNGQNVLAHCGIVACRSDYCRKLIKMMKDKKVNIFNKYEPLKKVY